MVNNCFKAVAKLLSLVIVQCACSSAFSHQSHPANAYYVTYSGGSWVSTGGSPAGPYMLGTYGYGGGGAGTTVNCSGEITATFTWVGPNAPPSYVSIAQTCAVGAIATGTGGSASASNTFPDSATWDPVTTTNETIPPDHSQFQGGTPSAPLINYSVAAGGPSVVVYINPTASCSLPVGAGSATVYYTASIAPINMTVSGSTYTSDNTVFLVGQGAVEGISSILPASAWSWTASGATPFANYDPTASTNQLTPLTTGASSMYTEYYASHGTANVSCLVTLGVPSGARPVGGTFKPTITKTLTVNLPMVSMTSGTVDATQLCLDGSIPVIAPYVAAPAQPVKFQAEVTTPSGYTGGNGTVQWAQLVTLATTRTDGTTNWRLAYQDPIDHSLHYTGLLDGGYPYPFTSGSGYSDGTLQYSTDSPEVDYELPYSPVIANMSLVMYVMYKPVAAGGGTSKPVPLGYFPWSWTGTATYSGGAYHPSSLSGTTSPAWTVTSIHPQWNYILTSPIHWYTY